MILVDSSVWIDHLRHADTRLAGLLQAGVTLVHPFVIGELACGRLSRRSAFLGELAKLPAAPVASHAEALGFLERHRLAGQGIGWVDVHLLASVMLAGRARLWTRDRRLRACAEQLGISMKAGSR